MLEYRKFPFGKKSFKIKYLTITTLKFLVFENFLGELASDILGMRKEAAISYTNHRRWSFLIKCYGKIIQNIWDKHIYGVFGKHNHWDIMEVLSLLMECILTTCKSESLWTGKLSGILSNFPIHLPLNINILESNV